MENVGRGFPAEILEMPLDGQFRKSIQQHLDSLRGFSGSIELRQGIVVGQQVVARAAAFLRTGDEVRPTEALDEHREAAR